VDLDEENLPLDDGSGQFVSRRTQMNKLNVLLELLDGHEPDDLKRLLHDCLFEDPDERPPAAEAKRYGVFKEVRKARGLEE